MEIGPVEYLVVEFPGNQFKGVVSDATTSKVTAIFNSEGPVSGNGGCSTYSASFTMTGKNGLKVSPAISTMMACEPS